MPARALIESHTLAQQFIGRDDDFWEITDDQESGGSSFPSGYSGVQCTGYACAILQRLGPERVQVYGFGPENEVSLIARDNGGHDFENPAEAEKIRRYYGDPKKWRKARANGKEVTFRP